MSRDDEVNRDSDEQDRQDMKRLVAGHDTALNDLMERHGQRLFHYLTRQLGSETEAEDCAQDAFVRVYVHRAKFQPSASFSTWLYTIATNRARNMRRGRRPEVSLDEDRDGGGSFDQLPDPAVNTTEQLMVREQTEEVRRAVQALPEDLRAPLVLFEFENLSQGEIAEILCCTRKAVETRVYRARQILRKTLALSNPSQSETVLRALPQ
jgi:RNA polymerase sigma-70 factor (ECF subfamily)